MHLKSEKRAWDLISNFYFRFEIKFQDLFSNLRGIECVNAPQKSEKVLKI